MLQSGVRWMDEMITIGCPQSGTLILSNCGFKNVIHVVDIRYVLKGYVTFYLFMKCIKLLLVLMI